MIKYLISLIITICAGCPLFAGSSAYAATTYDCTSKASSFSTTQSIDLSKTFTSDSSYSFNITTDWAGIVGPCTGKSSSLTFYSPLKTPYYINFVDEDGDTDVWMKITATSDSSTVTAYPESEYYYPNKYQTGVSITTELVSNPGVSTSNYVTTTSGSATVLVSSLGMLMSNATIRTMWLNNTTNYSWVWSWQLLKINYNPNATTCSMPNQMVKLPVVGLSDLVSGTNTGKTKFTLPVSCSTASLTSTSDISIWLTSNDIVDSSNKVLRNDESTSSGIGISLQDENGSDVVFSSSDAQESASTLLSISKGETISSVDSQIPLSASYSVYNTSDVEPGTVEATATLMFSYE
jgi:P pilus assembly protein, pilin FimA